MDFIEFLGEWETLDGHWTDPNIFDIELDEDEITQSEKVMGYPETSTNEKVDLDMPAGKVKK